MVIMADICSTSMDIIVVDLLSVVRGLQYTSCRCNLCSLKLDYVECSLMLQYNKCTLIIKLFVENNMRIIARVLGRF